MTIRKEIIEELMMEYKKLDDLISEGGLIRQLSKALKDLPNCLSGCTSDQD